MESIIEWLQLAILQPFPEVDLTALPGQVRDKLKPSPEQLAIALAAARYQQPELQRRRSIVIAHL
jgi:hypothetical protein